MKEDAGMNARQQGIMHRGDYLFLAVLWLFCTAINVNKAFHIDDTYHLEAARLIIQDPLHPATGLINWRDVPQPVHITHQPLAWFYLVAATGDLFGFAEIPLHLMLSLFTLLAICFFFKSARLVAPDHARLLTLLFALGPAFLVNQNLMIDVPLVAVAILFIYLLLRSPERPLVRTDLPAALLLSFGLLMKYTILPLLVVHLISILFRRQYTRLWVILIPVSALAAWSAWNLREFGYIHLLAREVHSFSVTDRLEMVVSLLSCLGAVAPFSILFFSGLFRKNRMMIPLAVLVLLLVLTLAGITWYSIISQDISAEILRYSFMLSGLILAGTVTWLGVTSLIRTKGEPTVSHRDVLIFSWFAGIAGFLILFAPFVATRHLLLLLPSVLLIGARLLDRVPKILRIQAMAATLSLGLLLGISDWIYADFYRRAADEIILSVPAGSRTWTTGHFGWQWYSKNKGMKEYATGSQEVRTGDFLVAPVLIPSQKIDSTLVLTPLKKFWHSPGLLTFFATGFDASFYRSTLRLPAWRFSKDPVDTLVLYQVTRKEEMNAIP